MHLVISDAYGDFVEVSRARGGFTGVFRAKVGDLLAVILGNARYLRAPPSLGRADVKMNTGYHDSGEGNLSGFGNLGVLRTVKKQ